MDERLFLRPLFQDQPCEARPRWKVKTKIPGCDLGSVCNGRGGSSLHTLAWLGGGSALQLLWEDWGPGSDSPETQEEADLKSRPKRKNWAGNLSEYYLWGTSGWSGAGDKQTESFLWRRFIMLYYCLCSVKAVFSLPLSPSYPGPGTSGHSCDMKEGGSRAIKARTKQYLRQEEEWKEDVPGLEQDL